MPTALITGILGQDGSLLAELLLSRGYRVVGVSRPGAIKTMNRELHPIMTRCEIVELDLACPMSENWASDLVARVEPDEIYYLAACHRSSESGAKHEPAQQQRMVNVNLSAPIALAHGLLARGKGRLVVATSSQMYTPKIPPLRVDENTQHDPATFYGVTKSGCQQAIRWLRERQGFLGSCAILFNHESPRRSPLFVSRKITRAAARIAAGLEVKLELADLSSCADFSSVQDVVEGLHAMALARQADDRVIASGQLHSIKEMCEIAFASVGLDWRNHVICKQQEGKRPALVGDPSRMAHELGWKVRRSFLDWIEEMVQIDQRRIDESEVK